MTLNLVIRFEVDQPVKSCERLHSIAQMDMFYKFKKIYSLSVKPPNLQNHWEQRPNTTRKIEWILYFHLSFQFAFNVN